MALTPAETAARNRLAALTPASFDTNNGYETAFPQANNDTALLGAAIAREVSAGVEAGRVAAEAAGTADLHQQVAGTAAVRADRAAAASQSYADTALALAETFSTDLALRSRIPPARDWRFRHDGAPADLTFARNAPAFRTGRFNLLESVAANAVRLEFAATGGFRGGLIEPARSNLLTHSDAIEQSVYNKVRASASANVAAAPDGTMTADKLVEDASANASHFMSRSVPVTANTDYVFSFYLKAAGRSRVNFQISAGQTATPVSGTISLDTETGTGLPAGSYFTRHANGWYRVSIPLRTAANVTSLTYFLSMVSNATNSISYTGDGVSGLLFWGQQLEAGLRDTSLIQTGAQTVTRPADTISTALGSWFNAAEGSAVIEFSAMRLRADDGGQDRLIEFSGDTADNSIVVRLGDSIGGVDLFVRSEGIAHVDTPSVAIGTNLITRIGIAWAPRHFTLAARGAIVADILDGNVPLGLNVMRLCSGLGAGSSAVLLRRALYWPRAVSATDLCSLTSAFAGDDNG